MKKLDFSRFIQLCREPGLGQRRFSMRSFADHYLNEPFGEVKAELERNIHDAIIEILHRPLQKYTTKEELEVSYQLSQIALPLDNWDFMACTDPEKTGLWCRLSDGAHCVVNDTTISRLGLYRGSEWGDAVHRFSVALYWWRLTVSCLWAAKIFRRLIPYFQAKKMLNGIVQPNNVAPEQATAAITTQGLLGESLLFDDISSTEADRLYSVYHHALFGSGDCNGRAGSTFATYVKELTIGDLQRHGVAADQAQRLMVSSRQSRPEMQLGMLWNQDVGEYQFSCQLGNRDGCGYPDQSRSSDIPESLLFEFIQAANLKTQEDCLRLLIVGGWGKAIDLARPAIASD